MSENEWKKEIVQLAAALIKADVGEMIDDRTLFPDISTLNDVEAQLDYVPFLLRHFLGNIFKNRKTDMKITIAVVVQASM